MHRHTVAMMVMHVFVEQKKNANRTRTMVVRRGDWRDTTSTRTKEKCRTQTFNGTILFIGLIIESLRSFAAHHTQTREIGNIRELKHIHRE